MIKYNFLDKLHKIKSVLDAWRSWKLTLMGKITIINTLVILQLTYQLSALRAPHQIFFKEFKKLVLDFLWDSKPHRIKYEKVIQGYKNSGLKLVDLKAKEITLKARWLIKFQEKKIPYCYGFFPIKDYRIWVCNIEEKHIKLIMDDSFARDLWIAWSKINFRIPEEASEITTQVVWGNSLILRAGQPIFDMQLVNSNIDYPMNLFLNGHFVKFEQLDSIVKDDISVLMFNALKAAIPVTWRSALREGITTEAITRWEFLKETSRLLLKK